MVTEILETAKENMEKSASSLAHNFSNIRTGRATSSLFDSVLVEAYGSMMPLNQTANVRNLDAHTVQIEPWDKTLLKAVEKGILASDLGLTPNNDGNVIRVTFPQLTEERRRELVKVCSQYAEEARIATRNVRRDTNQRLAKLKDEIGEDEVRRAESEVQKLTDDAIKNIDEMLEAKEAEVMEI